MASKCGTVLAVAIPPFCRDAPRAVSLTSSESAFVFSSDFLQVSPDLYGDNNTRLFTYWTVSFVCSFQNELKPEELVKCACIDV